MNQLRPLINLPVLLLASACGTGEARDSDGAGDMPPNAIDAAGASLAASPAHADADARPEVLVYKTPTCGCCSLWADHLREAGFEVETRDLNDLIPVKMDAGVPPRMSSCHTALIDGYVVEGHIPAEHVKRLLEERPDVVGIAVPGMPIGSPGMEGPGARPYQVLSWDRQGNVDVFAEVDPRR